MNLSSLKSSKHEERKMQLEYFSEKPEKKERSSGKLKDKREKMSEEEKELRKERKLGRKRDRIEESLQLEMKRRREEEKAKILSHQNGELLEQSPMHSREKHHRREAREISPYPRERSHERAESREKHRRSSENKRR